jgi:hypothetical protein
VTGRRERRRRKLLDELKERRVSSNFKLNKHPVYHGITCVFRDNLQRIRLGGKCCHVGINILNSQGGRMASLLSRADTHLTVTSYYVTEKCKGLRG